MVIYIVSWFLNKDLAKGKSKSRDKVLGFSVICRNSKDALSCLDYHFRQSIDYSSGITIDDGEIVLKRSIVDSRNFNANYLLMDGMREPIILSDLKSNYCRWNQIF